MEGSLRWLERFEKFKKALGQLKSAKELYEQRELTELEKQGFIQVFEYTFDLSWNLIRDYFIYQGITEIRGSRDAFRLAFKYGIVEDGELWMEMIQARNLTSHTYDEKMAEELLGEIIRRYYPAFERLRSKFEDIRKSYE